MTIKQIIESAKFEKFIIIIIIINAVTLGLETMIAASSQMGRSLILVDKIFLGIFAIEILLKLFVYKKKFASDPWRVFDFLVVSIAFLPTTGPLAVVRALRVLRVLRLVSTIPSLRRVVDGLLAAVPGLSSVTAVMLLIFYVASVVSTKLFGAEFPEWFGSIWASAYSLFQIMTLESWSMGIVRPVLEKFPGAWLFFIPFILIATFTMLNLFIAVIVNAMQAESENIAEERAAQGHDDLLRLLQEVGELRRLIEKQSKHLRVD